MKKAHELPQAVNNLRAIWDKKKVEMKFTQVEAAAELGWSQGAISHYLNNITDLGPAAVIKFANFLGVDPRDIDPNVIEHLPNVEKIVVRYDSSNLSKTIDKPHYVKNPPGAFWINVDVNKSRLFRAPGEGYPLGPNGGKSKIANLIILFQVVPVKELPDAQMYAVQLKKQKHMDIYYANALPPKDSISKMFSVLREMRLMEPA